LWGGSPSTSYFVYQSNTNPQGQKVQYVNTYRVPLSPTSANNFAAALGTTKELMMGKLLEGSAEGPMEQIKKWASTLGYKTEEVYGGDQVKSPATAPTKGYSNITKAKDASGNVIEMGVKGGKWYNTATGKEIQ